MAPNHNEDASCEDAEDALVLVRLGHEGGGRVLPTSILGRPAASRSRGMFLVAQDHGWLDGDGWVTSAGREALRGDDGR